MKLCTIIYDGPALCGDFGRASLKDFRAVEGACLDDMMGEVEALARRLECPEAIISWAGTAHHPTRLGVICEDVLADRLRMGLPDYITVELDGPKRQF